MFAPFPLPVFFLPHSHSFRGGVLRRVLSAVVPVFSGSSLAISHWQLSPLFFPTLSFYLPRNKSPSFSRRRRGNRWELWRGRRKFSIIHRSFSSPRPLPSFPVLCSLLPLNGENSLAKSRMSLRVGCWRMRRAAAFYYYRFFCVKCFPLSLPT